MIDYVCHTTVMTYMVIMQYVIVYDHSTLIACYSMLLATWPAGRIAGVSRSGLSEARASILAPGRARVRQVALDRWSPLTHVTFTHMLALLSQILYTVYVCK